MTDTYVYVKMIERGMNMKKILITGFMPFGGETINPSYEAIKKMNCENIKAEVLKLEVPTAYQKSISFVVESILSFKPDIIIMVGQAGGRKEISIERVAINIDDSKAPDNLGEVRTDQQIVNQGEPAYFSTLPIKKIAERIKSLGIPAGISNTAGTYVCNHLLYGVLHEIDSRKLKHIQAGFIHVPYIKEQVLDKKDVFALELDEIVKALESAIQTSLEG